MAGTVRCLPAHAKLNLTLRVLGRRPDGLHEVETLMQAISLHDLLEAAPAETTSLEGADGAPAGEDNLVLRAARALESAAGRPLPTRFRLLKRIPSGAGLGGGSSDAAAALRLLAALHALDTDLVAVASSVGADVPFFLAGGAQVASGTGRDLRPAAPADGWFALAWPGLAVSTAEVYSRWRPGTPVAGGNDLQPAAMEAEPRLADLARRLGPAWRMTGSGSAFFLPTRTRAQAEAATAGLDCWADVVRPLGPWA